MKNSSAIISLSVRQLEVVAEEFFKIKKSVYNMEPKEFTGLPPCVT